VEAGIGVGVGVGVGVGYPARVATVLISQFRGPSRGGHPHDVLFSGICVSQGRPGQLHELDGRLMMVLADVQSKQSSSPNVCPIS